ncbi:MULTISPECIES: MFS transporter [Catenuloplanes]|uniref:EmrB/QacA subfamily drug resistance transporter n=1 Tax=Catenuloplanes niger TaxID=587534 RepID=A0AAE3ZWP2_9ACTN|nr:MFS transporter [Catenuloplanes niger]MDR7327454.1 EmrB/QacA subfamily drug resistance transporter [Catenuloplanes niger]
MTSDHSRGVTVGLRSPRGPILLALMLSTGLIAIDATILATAVPSIVGELGSFDQFPWLFSVYLLAQAVSVPIYSKLADTVGRKPIILVGIAVFLVSSVLCAVAWNMTALIAFRALQGLGAGAVAPVSVTIIGDIYSVEERARVQGYIAGVWAAASVLGPTMGGLFAQFASWRWIFVVNVPLCLAAGWMLLRAHRETVAKRRHHIDYAGAATLTVALTALILAVLEGGNAWAWRSVPSVATFTVGAVALAGFVLIERRAAEPIIDLSLLRRPIILSTTCAGLGVGAMLTGITSFAPTYLENSIGTVPLVSGLAVAAFTLGWPLAATNAGRLYLRYGFRSTAVVGSAIATAGAVALAGTAAWPSPYTVAAVTFVIGFGLGWTAVPTLIAAQSSVDWEQRGVVTGVSIFARTAGSAIGVAVFGAIATSIIAAGAGEHDFDTIVSASTWVFASVAVAAALTVAAVLAMPRTPAVTRPAGPADHHI